MRVFMCLAFLMLYCSVFAEKINGPANLRRVPKGDVVISLKDGVQVYIEKKNDDWFKVIFIAYVSEDHDQFNQNVNAGVELFDCRGKSIGKTVKPFSDFEYFEEGNRVGLLITLYTYKNNIVESSILENEVVKLIKSNELRLSSLSNLEDLIIEKWSSIEGYQSSIVMEPLTGGPIPPGIRFIFFIHQQEVVAVVGNDKMKGFDFECFGTTEISESRLNIYYMNEETFSKREFFEKSLYVALSKMY